MIGRNSYMVSRKLSKCRTERSRGAAFALAEALVFGHAGMASAINCQYWSFLRNSISLLYMPRTKVRGYKMNRSSGTVLEP
jgi:hypothetical protein